ncbi:MAG: small basic protein [Candidatus Omnitrophica bacterium]|nr:small basic protein [Candidatus Omnitrophota bacterium]
MSQHPSLKSDQTGAAFRSVLKRYERIKEMSEKDKWDEEKDSIFGLPKLKRIKFKVKKAKSAEAEAAEGAAEGAAAPAAEGAAEKPAAAEGQKKTEEKK